MTIGSVYYYKVQSPLCDWIVGFFPTWLAPNLITSLGFCSTLMIICLQFYLYGLTTEGPVDNWFCYLMAVCVFYYSTMDNLDGKQARRTGAGSPMGMLFDHTCDAMTAVFY